MSPDDGEMRNLSLNQYMEICLKQAALARTLCAPNPAVGAVLVDPEGQVIGVGHTQQRGGPHAEIVAIANALERGHSLQGATAYVSLEPCSHHGRTGPCADELIRHGIRKVVASVIDPNPLVAGKGIAKLRAAGVEVIVGPGGSESRELNLGFFSRMVRKTPWVRMKVAASLDGQTALKSGESKWITGHLAREDGHQWRQKAGAILTGIGTVTKDDPRLDVRLEGTLHQPLVAVVDSQLNISPKANLFQAKRPVIIYCAVKIAQKRAMLESAGAIVVSLPSKLSTSRPQVDLAAMLLDLANREVNEVHVEAGAKLNGSLFEMGLVDEILLYLAPKIMGQGYPIAELHSVQSLAQTVALEFISTQVLGTDLRIVARIAGRSDFQ